MSERPEKHPESRFINLNGSSADEATNLFGFAFPKFLVHENRSIGLL
jgi:hypothetical protein